MAREAEVQEVGPCQFSEFPNKFRSQHFVGVISAKIMGMRIFGGTRFQGGHLKRFIAAGLAIAFSSFFT